MKHKVGKEPYDIDAKTAKLNIFNAQLSFMLSANIETLQNILDGCYELGYFLEDCPNREDVLTIIDNVKSHYITRLSTADIHGRINKTCSDLALLLTQCRPDYRIHFLGCLTNYMIDSNIYSANHLLAKKSIKYGISAIRETLTQEEIEIIQNRYASKKLLESVLRSTPLWVIFGLY